MLKKDGRNTVFDLQIEVSQDHGFRPGKDLRGHLPQSFHFTDQETGSNGR